MTPELSLQSRAALRDAAAEEAARVYRRTVPEYHNQPAKHVPPRPARQERRTDA